MGAPISIPWPDRVRIAFHRITRREYWPTLVQYAILGPFLAPAALRYGPMTFTCCNPGITGGGGMIGESKKTILDGIGDPRWILPATLIDASLDAAARARQALDAIARRPELGGFPVVLKPDAGQRGFALKLARTPRDIEDYFKTVHSPALVQRFHPGPEECGILWSRRPGEDSGFIFSITRKDFPFITGDGRRTLERLVLDHARYHCQAAVFLSRFAGERSRILAEGESIRLAQAGNHCQGTRFRDGADLITPALERVIEELVRSFASPLDMCRLDLRYESDDALRRGEGFAIVELNGTAGETTNIYDPDRSIVWAYRTLAAQWKLLYELGAERRRTGIRPLPLRDLLREIRRHYRERSGSAIAD